MTSKLVCMALNSKITSWGVAYCLVRFQRVEIVLCLEIPRGEAFWVNFAWKFQEGVPFWVKVLTMGCME